MGRVWVCTVVFALVANFAAGEVTEGEVYIGPGSTAAKTQAKLWFNDGAWWAILLDGSDQYIHRFHGNTAVRLPDGYVDEADAAQVDVLWTGEYLFVLMGHQSAPELFKYTYDPVERRYVLVPGFPVAMPIGIGSLAATIAVDSTGQAWISYRSGTDIRVVWSTTADHTGWNLSGLTLQGGVDPLDVSAMVAFDGKVGVLWSDQTRDEYAFRCHRDGQPDTSWDSTEIVAIGAHIAEDHINLAVTPAQEILAATKDKSDNVHLWRRSVAGVWSGPYDVGPRGTRPNVLYDEDGGEVYVLYTDVSNGYSATPKPILFKHAPLTDLAQLGTAPVDTFLDFESYNDVTSTKQTLTNRSGLLAVANHDAYAGFRRIAFGPPLVDVAASLYRGLAPVTVDFTGAGVAVDDGTIVSYAWDFGDGSTSTARNPSHLYDTPGLYEITLTVTDDSSRSTSSSIHIDLGDPIAPGSIVGLVNFQTPGSTTPPGYAADIGETFDAARGYGWDQSLDSRDYVPTTGDARFDTYVFTPNTTPATWEHLIQNGDYLVSLAVGSPRWTGLHFLDLEGQTVIDGVETSGGIVEIVDHPVTVTDGRLTVRIGSGADAKKTKLCYIAFRRADGEPPPPPLEVTAAATPADGEAPLPVAFGATVSGGSGTVASWAWDFDDGATATEQNPLHTYGSAGTYVASVTVTDDVGTTASATVTVTVSEPPPPPAPDPAPAPAGTAEAQVNFQPEGEATPDGYLADTGAPFDAARGHGWNDGVATQSRGANDDVRLDTYAYVSNTSTATWEYVLPNGSYQVTVVAGSPAWNGIHHVQVEGATVIDGIATGPGEFVEVVHATTVADGRLSVTIGGGSSKKTKLCYLLVQPDGGAAPPAPPPAPTATIAASTTSGDAPLAVSFTGTGASDGGAIVGYAWTFGDGATSSAQNPSHTFGEGTFTVTLTVTDDYGQTGSATTTITANAPVVTPPPAPTAAIAASTTSGDAPLAVSFLGTGTSDGGSIVGYAWTFGDGATSSAQNPSHTFSEGTFTVTLTVTDDYGQTGSATTTIVANTPAAPAPPPSGGEVVAQVNFGPGSATPPAGYLADSGGVYDSAAGFGWDNDTRVKARGVNADVRLDTYAYVVNTETARWEYALPDGDYLVTLVVGSPLWHGVHHVALEGTSVVDGVATDRGAFVEKTDVPVTVSDGKLTVAIGGGSDTEKTKLCYLVIRTAN